MGLGDLTLAAVHQAVKEHDQLGREDFHAEHGYKPMLHHILAVNERLYDVRAICGAAIHRSQPQSEHLDQTALNQSARRCREVLENLEFTVLDGVPRHEILDDSGTPIQSACEIAAEPAGWAVTIHSRGGTAGSQGERNPGYKYGLELLVRRLARIDATIRAAFVDSDRTSLQPVEERQVLEDLPIIPSEATALTLTTKIMSAAAKVRIDQSAKAGHNNTRRVRIRFTTIRPTRLRMMELALTTGHIRASSLFVVTWNTEQHQINDNEYQGWITQTAGDGAPIVAWPIEQGDRNVAQGDDVMLFRQGHGQGIVASGVAVEYVQAEARSEGTAKNLLRVLLRACVPHDDRMPIERLINVTQDVSWDVVQATGMLVTDRDAKSLRAEWDNWLRDLVSHVSGEEAGVADRSLVRDIEGSVTRVSVNRYERSRAARAACIDQHGAQCAACGLNFEKMYGEIGRGFIHVHHIVPVSQSGGAYKLDPVKDLVPVCPNCHAMLHIGVEEPRTVEHLRNLIPVVVHNR